MVCFVTDSGELSICYSRILLAQDSWHLGGRSSSRGMFYRSGADPRGAITPPPQPLDGCWPRNGDARPIKSRFYQSQNAPKLATLNHSAFSAADIGMRVVSHGKWLGQPQTVFFEVTYIILEMIPHTDRMTKQWLWLNWKANSRRF